MPKVPGSDLVMCNQTCESVNYQCSVAFEVGTNDARNCSNAPIKDCFGNNIEPEGALIDSTPPFLGNAL